jgi:REP element-mobilizing transposase RayT
MRAPFTQLYLHCVWATWDRLPLLTARLQPAVYAEVQARCELLACKPLAIGGLADHVHVLVALSPGVAVAQLVKELKAAAAPLIARRVQTGHFMTWQDTYGALSVGPADVARACRYVEQQPAHHAQNELWEEWERTQTYGEA